MCTASWLFDDAGYHLLFNRDERLTRAPGLPPRLLSLDGVRVLAPIDGASGGSWIAVNQFGVSVCILNGANLTGTHSDVGGSRSRGFLVQAAATSQDARSAIGVIRSLELSSFAAFTLAAFDPHGAAELIEWDGMGNQYTCTAEISCGALTSSSFDTERVRASRLSLFGERNPCTADGLYEVHCSHIPARSACSVCMHRPDAATVSFTAVRVTPGEIEVRYWPGPPCEFQYFRNAAASFLPR